MTEEDDIRDIEEADEEGYKNFKKQRKDSDIDDDY